jgi:hypothetical protein
LRRCALAGEPEGYRLELASGASAADREGFQRPVAEVGIGKGGDRARARGLAARAQHAYWHRLLEICALTETLILDEDGLYDPGEFNDRLLLGLKRTMSEAELRFLRARLSGDILSKARRGELETPLPCCATLHNPRYGGAFVFGRRRTRKDAEGSTSIHELPREQWAALIPNAHVGCTSWEQYERNQRLLAGNAHAYGPERAAGPAREGPALLQGLVVCGRGGRRMTVRYHHRRNLEVPDYQCVDESIQDGGSRCQTIPAQGLEARGFLASRVGECSAVGDDAAAVHARASHEAPRAVGSAVGEASAKVAVDGGGDRQRPRADGRAERRSSPSTAAALRA